MVKILEHFPEPDAYPDEWFDGRAREFVGGYDFECTAREFGQRLRRAAWRRGFTLRTRVDRDANLVVAQVAGPRTDKGWHPKPQEPLPSEE